MYNIDNTVPMPHRKSNSAEARETIANLKSGESFFIPTERKASAIHQTLRARSKELSIRLLIREVEGGVRVWRK